MKMGNTLSPWRYDGAPGDTLQLAGLCRLTAIQGTR